MSLTCAALRLSNTHLTNVPSVVAFDFSFPEADCGSEILALPSLINKAVELVNLLQCEA